jgi:hypothetical protein
LITSNLLLIANNLLSATSNPLLVLTNLLFALFNSFAKG